MVHSLTVVSILLGIAGGVVAAEIPPAAQWRGVNDAGGEFNSSAKGLPGKYDKDYHFSGLETLRYFRLQGFNMVRVPMRWERVQRVNATAPAGPELVATLEQTEVDRLLGYLDNAQKAGMGVVIDMHNYGRYGYVGAEGKWISAVVGKDAPVAGDAFANFWKLLATALKDKPALWGYDLCNEPQYKVAEEWKELTRQAVKAIRAVDSAHYVLIEGTGWSHGKGWEERHGKPWIEDPAGKVIYEAHDYLDADNSGTYRKSFADESKGKDGKAIDVAARAVARIEPFAKWCQANNVPGIIGEFGVPRKDPGWIKALDAYVKKAEAEKLGWCYWAAGEWWGEGYSLSIQPKKAKGVPVEQWEHRPQMEVLRRRVEK